MVGVIWVAFFSWLAVTGWAKQRRREREAFYRDETEKRLLDKGQASVEQILKVRNQQERVRWLQRREGLKLGGLVTTAVGFGIIVGLPMIEGTEQRLAGAGAIPLAIGLALLLYAYSFYPKLSDLSIDDPSVPPGERSDQPD
jgi:hypothetical protein